MLVCSTFCTWNINWRYAHKMNKFVLQQRCLPTANAKKYHLKGIFKWRYTKWQTFPGAVKRCKIFVWRDWKGAVINGHGLLLVFDFDSCCSNWRQKKGSKAKKRVQLRAIKRVMNELTISRGHSVNSVIDWRLKNGPPFFHCGALHVRASLKFSKKKIN